MRRIDVYMDIAKSNNCWGMIYTKESNNPLARGNKEFIRFHDNREMEYYVRSQFKDEEIRRHVIDYDCVEYQYFTNSPNYNRVVIKYKEINNGKRREGKIILPEEFEDVFLEILKINKNLPANYVLDSRYHRKVDVNKREKENRKETYRTIKMSLNEFFAKAGEKIKTPDGRKKVVKAISLFVTLSMLGTMIGKGYSLVTNNEFNSEYLHQDNPVKNFQDFKIYLNKGNVGLIIEKLIKNQYDDINVDEIKQALELIKNIEDSNYDNNKSFNSFNYSDYFKYETPVDENDFSISDKILNNIEKLYNDCFTKRGENVTFNKEKANKYIDYVISLAFMYDAYHNVRGTSDTFSSQSIISPYATSEEISVYDNYPLILRYIILNQLKGVLTRSDYKVKIKPAYYFHDTDKLSLIGEVNKRLSACVDELLLLSTKNKPQK